MYMMTKAIPYAENSIHSTPPHLPAFTDFQPCLPQCFLGLERVQIDVLLKGKHTTVPYSDHFDQL